MDLGDRYLNARAAKALLREDKVKESLEVMTEFIKDPLAEDFVDHLQCSWYEVEVSESHLRTRKLLRSHRILSFLLGHYHQYIEDQVL